MTPRRRLLRWPWFAVLLANGVVLQMMSTALTAEPEWLTGAALEKALAQPVSISREAAPVRELLDQLAQSQRIAVRLDRRIDPSQPVSLQVQQQPLHTAFDEVARQVDARCAPLGETLLIGPTAELDRLLTQAEALQSRLKSDRSLPAARRLQLTRAHTLQWNELDRPADVLETIARQWQLEADNAADLPHDLWSGGTLVGVNAIEALSFLLGQFDRTVDWDAGMRSLRFVPLPVDVRIVRTHRLQGRALAELRRLWPDVAVEQRGPAVAVTATALEHAAIAAWLGGAQPPAAAVTPLDRRRFTLRVVRSPLAAVLATLQAQGVPLDYDADALQAAGVDLQTLISIEFKAATLEELLVAICRPVGLQYAIDADGVRLTPPQTESLK